MTDDQARTAIQSAMDLHPDLTSHGFGNPHDASFSEWRDDLLSDFGVDQFQRARRYLSAFARRQTLNRRRSSYGLKHSAEDEQGGYVSNGAFIAAAVDLGFRMERINYGPNAWLGIGRRKAAKTSRHAACAANPDRTKYDESYVITRDHRQISRINRV